MVFKKEDFKKVLLSKPKLIIGKNGITDEFVAHLNTLFKKNKIIKVKALKSITKETPLKELGKEISQRTQSHLIDMRGRSLILSKQAS
ncbi:MAG: YhbY family RNA-binding protein [Promethearchaeota archaeon]